MSAVDKITNQKFAEQHIPDYWRRLGMISSWTMKVYFDKPET